VGGGWAQLESSRGGRKMWRMAPGVGGKEEGEKRSMTRGAAGGSLIGV
jgi:hypothetical protein